MTTGAHIEHRESEEKLFEKWFRDAVEDGYFREE
jgi:hypothetical protein